MISSKTNNEYRRRIKVVRKAIRGKYPKIAEISGFSIDTVRSVMTFRFRNDAILEVAEQLAGIETIIENQSL